MNAYLFFIGAFIVGSFPTAYLAGKALKGIDIREHGSGNVGATNAFRILGKGPGIAVFAVDFLKGFLPVFLFWRFSAPEAATETLALWVGVWAILGHVFTPFLGFKGGKGVAVGAGVLLAVSPILWAITVTTWVGVFLLSKTVSVSSLTALLLLVLASFLLGKPLSEKATFLLIFLFILWTHRTNLRLLLRGQEKHF